MFAFVTDEINIVRAFSYFPKACDLSKLQSNAVWEARMKPDGYEVVFMHKGTLKAVLTMFLCLP